jgi:hypothetical protein
MRHFVLVAAILAAVTSAGTSAQQGPRIETIDLGPPPGGGFALAAAITSRGVVAGTINWGGGEEGDRHRAFTWTPSGGYRIVFENAEIVDINDLGQVVGLRAHCAYDESCDPRGFLWSPSGGAVDLGALRPSAINDAGTVAGFCTDLESGCVRSRSGAVRALPGGLFPDDVNERGVVAGSYVHQDGFRRPAVWASSFGLRNLDPGTPLLGHAYSINDNSIAAGYRQHRDFSGSRIQAMLWTPFGGAGAGDAATSEAFAISNRGWAVGHTGGRPALWLVGARRVELPLPELATNGAALDVNDAGQIVGPYERSDGERGSLLWIVR